MASLGCRSAPPRLAALAALLAVGVRTRAVTSTVAAAPQLLDLRVDNGSTPFAGDSSLLTTVSPNDDGFRDAAEIHFRLQAPAVVTMDVTRTVKVPQVVYTLTETLDAGAHTMVWDPLENINPRTYLIRMTVVNKAGRRTVYGSPNAFVGRHLRGPVVRIQGIDAGFARAELRTGPGRGPPHRDRRAFARVEVLPVRPGEGRDVRRQPVRGRRHRPAADRDHDDAMAQQAAHDHAPHPQPAERPLLRVTRGA